MQTKERRERHAENMPNITRMYSLNVVASKQPTKGGRCNQTSKWSQRPTSNKPTKGKISKNKAKSLDLSKQAWIQP